MCLFSVCIHWRSESKGFSTKLANLQNCNKRKLIIYNLVWIWCCCTHVGIGHSAMYVAMLLFIEREKEISTVCESDLYNCLTQTFSLVRSRKPLPQTMHLNLSLDPSIWIFLCFAKAFMFVEVRPHIEQVLGPSTWILFICDRRFSLFLYHSLQISHCSRSCTSWSDLTWYLCMWILLETLPHKSQITRWSTSCTWRICFAMPFDRIILPQRGQATFECLIWCSSKSSAVANGRKEHLSTHTCFNWLWVSSIRILHVWKVSAQL